MLRTALVQASAQAHAQTKTRSPALGPPFLEALLGLRIKRSSRGSLGRPLTVSRTLSHSLSPGGLGWPKPRLCHSLESQTGSGRLYSVAARPPLPEASLPPAPPPGSTVRPPPSSSLSSGPSPPLQSVPPGNPTAPTSTVLQTSSLLNEVIPEPAPKETLPEVKKPLWQRVKDEASHYWDGSKLLAKEIRISTRLAFKLLQGSRLTRREQRQLKRTFSDLLRLVPFLVFILVPFMEFLLPVFLKLFPNMLPSTFESKFAEEEKKKKLLRVRLEMAKFLQETVTEMSSTGKKEAVQVDMELFRKIRTSGAVAPTPFLLAIARKFQDDLTLENLSRPQLVSMCRYMNINAFGTDNFLRYQIRKKMQELALDDKMIAAEGVDSLTIPELQSACMARGIRTSGVSPARMRQELGQWLELHLNNEIPSSLLILSRAFLLTDRIPDEASSAEALQATLSSLPDSVVNEAVLKHAETEGKATYKQKLDVIEQQEELIADELEQEEAESAAKAAQEADLKAKVAKSSRKDGELPPPEEAYRGDTIEEDEIRITDQQLKQLGEVLGVLSSKSATSEERELLDLLRKERDANKEDASKLQEFKHKVQVALKAAVVGHGPEEDVAPSSRKIRDTITEIVEPLRGAMPPPSSSPRSALASEPQGQAHTGSLPGTAGSSGPEPAGAMGSSGPSMSESAQGAPLAAADSPSPSPTVPDSTPKDPNFRAVSRLDSRVEKMIAKIESELQAYDSEIGSKLNLITPFHDASDLQPGSLMSDGQGGVCLDPKRLKVTVEDLEAALKLIRDHPVGENPGEVERKIRKIVKSLDKDGDGVVTLEEIVGLAKAENEKEGQGEVIDKAKEATLPAPDKP